jgi:hypothetical protein
MGNTGLYLTNYYPDHTGFRITGVGFNEGALHLFATSGSIYVQYHRPNSIYRKEMTLEYCEFVSA